MMILIVIGTNCFGQVRMLSLGSGASSERSRGALRRHLGGLWLGFSPLTTVITGGSDRYSNPLLPPFPSVAPTPFLRGQCLGAVSEDRYYWLISRLLCVPHPPEIPAKVERYFVV